MSVFNRSLQIFTFNLGKEGRESSMKSAAFGLIQAAENSPHLGFADVLEVRQPVRPD
jgi:hypothetical protein